jgi:mannose-6-phosphate isomerase-like protein (cupin superfamily)
MLYARYTFVNHSGYLIHPQLGGHDWLALGHTANHEPWVDAAVHRHAVAEELYFLRQGKLWFVVGDAVITLGAGEILMVRPQVAHAIVGGAGQIEHFGLRAPALADKEELGPIPADRSPAYEGERELRAEWGFRASLASPANHNCWLIGQGAARFHSESLALAYLRFATHDAANAGLGTRHRLHYHRRSWEYYCVLAGGKTLQIEDELVTIGAGDLVEVNPGTSHTLHGRQAPFEGLTVRVPVTLDDKFEP